MFKVNNKDTRRRSGIFIVTFEHISHLNCSASIVNFEHVFADWKCNIFSASTWTIVEYKS